MGAGALAGVSRKSCPADRREAAAKKALHPHGHYVFDQQRMHLPQALLEERNRAYAGYVESGRSMFGDPPYGRSALERVA